VSEARSIVAGEAGVRVDSQADITAALGASFGSAGLITPWLNGAIRDATGSYDQSYMIVIALMLVAAALAQISRRLGQPAPRPARARELPAVGGSI